MAEVRFTGQPEADARLYPEARAFCGLIGRRAPHPPRWQPGRLRAASERTETGCRSPQETWPKRGTLPMRTVARPNANRYRSRSRTETDALPADVQPMRTAPHPHRGRLPSVQCCRCTETWPTCTASARERSAARPVADVHRIDWPISPKCTRGWANVTRLPSGKILPPYPVTGCQRTEWPMPRQAAGSHCGQRRWLR
jgi:hypothetical protein